MKNTNIVLETVPNISVSEGTSYKQAYMYKVGEAWLKERHKKSCWLYIFIYENSTF